MSRVVIAQGSLSVIDLCDKTLTELAVKHPKFAEQILLFRQKAPEIIRACAANAIAGLTGTGIGVRDYLVDETRYRYYLAGKCPCGAEAQKINAMGDVVGGDLNADYCLFTDKFHYGMGVKVAGGKIEFNTVRHSGEYSSEQKAEMAMMKERFMRLLLTEFLRAAMSIVFPQVTAQTYQIENGHRAVHLQGVRP